MVVEDCSFETERLVVGDWHRLGLDALSAFVVRLLTPAVTRALPPDWGGAYDDARARRWITDREVEGTVLLVEEGRAPAGLVLLHEDTTQAGVHIRIGYLLAEEAWGRGLGSALLVGLVRWARSQPSVRSLVGGVARDNLASIRILERNGFVPSDGSPATADELEYRLDL